MMVINHRTLKKRVLDFIEICTTCRRTGKSLLYRIIITNDRVSIYPHSENTNVMNGLDKHH